MEIIRWLIAEAEVLAGGDHPCDVIGHNWISDGGSNCGCIDGNCSVPTHKCSGCGDFDYGENEDAREIRSSCEWRVK